MIYVLAFLAGALIWSLMANVENAAKNKIRKEQAKQHVEEERLHRETMQEILTPGVADALRRAEAVLNDPVY